MDGMQVVRVIYKTLTAKAPGLLSPAYEPAGAIFALHGANDALAALVPTACKRWIGSFYRMLMQLSVIWHKDWKRLTRMTWRHFRKGA
jgi:hypothetical protein